MEFESISNSRRPQIQPRIPCGTYPYSLSAKLLQFQHCSARYLLNKYPRHFCPAQSVQKLNLYEWFPPIHKPQLREEKLTNWFSPKDVLDLQSYGCQTRQMRHLNHIFESRPQSDLVMDLSYQYKWYNHNPQGYNLIHPDMGSHPQQPNNP